MMLRSQCHCIREPIRFRRGCEGGASVMGSVSLCEEEEVRTLSWVDAREGSRVLMTERARWNPALPAP